MIKLSSSMWTKLRKLHASGVDVNQVLNEYADYHLDLLERRRQERIAHKKYFNRS